MNGMIGVLKSLYYRNKLFFVIAVIAVLVFIIGCSSQGSTGGYAAPSGPVGGGC